MAYLVQDLMTSVGVKILSFNAYHQAAVMELG